MATKIDDAFKNVYAAKTAQSVWNDLKTLRQRRPIRWIWELLQNASDASPPVNNHLIAEVKYRPGQLIFSHNGRSFKASEVAHLIASGSTKYEDEEAIGEFGSGFLTTHLLSLEIEVRGQLDDGREFAFLLARNMESRDALSESMKQAEEDFKKSLNHPTPFIPDPFTTQFIYPIKDDAVNAIEEGIKTLEQCAPYVVVFNKKFDYINVDIDLEEFRKTLSFKAVPSLALDSSPIQQIRVTECENGKAKEKEYLLAQSERGTSVTVPLESNRDGWECLSVENIPRLFKVFPLIGTKSFSFPAVINNSTDFFTPAEGRDDVPLGESNDDANIQNRIVIEEAFKLLIDLIEHASSKRWHHVNRWAEVPTIQHNDHKTREWLRKCIRENFINQTQQKCVVLNVDDNPITPKDAWLPMAENDESVKEFWNLLNDLREYSKKLPKRDEAAGWCKTIKSWEKIDETKPPLFPFTVNSRKLLSRFVHTNKCTCLESLQKLLHENVCAVEWLNQLYEFLKLYGFNDLISNYPLVPNQVGEFHLLKDLHRDRNIDDQLKTIDKWIGGNLSRELRHTELNSLENEAGAKDWGNDYVVSDLISRLQRHTEKDPDDNFKKASRHLFAWLVHQNQQDYWDSLSNVSVFTKDGTYYRPLSSAFSGDPLLAPIRAWSEDLQQFSELFPSDRILDDSFFEVIPDTGLWQMLCEQNFVRRHMVWRLNNQSNLKNFSPEIYENEDDGRDHESEETFFAIRVVAWEAIMEKVRNSRDNAYLFWRFLIEYLIPRDNGVSLEEKTAQCKSCGKIHKYYLSIWLKAVRSNKWIRQGDLRFHADAQSLANLLREKGWKLHSLETPTTVKLLNAIDIPPSDLRFELITGNPEARDALVNTMTELHQITGGDLSQVQAMVQHVQNADGNLDLTLDVLQHMQEDNKFLEYLADRQKQMRRVQENKWLGEQVEDLVKENLEKKNFEGKGFTVEPTGEGSDFEMEDTEGIITLNVNREDRKWLIEVKSTRTDGGHQSVRMTSAQAQTAVREKDKFLLCVVPLGQEDITPETVRENMRFIQNIGDSIAPLWDGLKGLKKKSTDIDIILDVEEGKAGIRVQKSVWEDENVGFRLEDLVENLK